MARFDTPNSTETYEVPDGYSTLLFELYGAGGGDGAGGASGGLGGLASGEIAVNSGDIITAYVAEQGADAGSSPGAGGLSPFYSGGDGDGFSGGDPENGGGGAGSTALEGPGGTLFGIADGGGGGAGDSPSNNYGRGGGGGARGGQGGGNQANSDTAEDGDGSGLGGDGGDANSLNTAGDPGDPGGAEVDASVTNATTTIGGGNDGDAVVLVAVPLSWDETSTAIDATSRTTIDVSWTGDPSVDEYYVEYRVAGAGSWTRAVTTTAESATIDSLDPGTAYEVRVGATTGIETEWSGTLSATTTLSAATDVQITATGETSLTVAWTDNEAQNDGYRVYRSTDGGSTWTLAETLGASAESATLSGLLHGTQYTVDVRVYTDDIEVSGDATPQATTDFPDVGALDFAPIDASVEDELTVQNPETMNAGQYRVQYRVTDSGNAYASAGTFAHDDGSGLTVSGLADGEQYDLRFRQETADASDVWTNPLTPVTLLPAPGVAVISASLTATSVPIAITDNADNEDDYLVERERQRSDGGYWSPETLATLDPDPTSYDDTTPDPDTTYRYTATARTEHSEASATVTVTTPSLDGVQRQRIPAHGVVVEVEAADGTIRRPTVLGAMETRPALSDYQRVELPIRRDESWLEDRWDEAALRVWRDGDRLPIDGLADVEMQADRTVLHGRGGDDLDAYVEREYEFATVHEIMADILNDTAYSVTVDDPGGETDRTVQELADELEFAEANTNGSEDPINVTSAASGTGNGEVKLSKTTYGIEGENAAGSFTTRGSTFYGDEPDFSNVFAAGIVNGAVEFSFTPTHDIPSENVAVKLRRHADDAAGELLVRIDGTIIHGDVVGASSGADRPLEWIDAVGGEAYNINPGSGFLDEPASPPRLEAGTEYTIRVEVKDFTAGGTSYTAFGNYEIDYLALYDDRFEPSFPNTTDANDALPGPEAYPESATATFATETTIGAVSAAELLTTWRDAGTSGVQAIAVSNDGGSTWHEISNAASLSHTFDELGPSIQFRATIARLDSGDSTTPTQGDGTQALQSATLSVDTSGSPTVSAKTYRGSRLDILQQAASRGDVIFEVGVDDSAAVDAANPLEVIVTYPGQRTSDAGFSDLIEYRVRKKPTERVDALNVFGRRTTITGETFTASAAAADLEHTALVEGSERVYDPDTGETFDRGEANDYEMSYGVGEITRSSGSSMTLDATYAIDYDWQPSASQGRPPIERQRQTHIPELIDFEECRDAAHWLIERLATTPWEATVTIPRTQLDFGLADEIDPDELPGAGAYRVRQMTTDAEKITLELGRGTTVNEAVDKLRSRLTTVERTV